MCIYNKNYRKQNQALLFMLPNLSKLFIEASDTSLPLKPNFPPSGTVEISQSTFSKHESRLYPKLMRQIHGSFLNIYNIVNK